MTIMCSLSKTNQKPMAVYFCWLS